MGQDTKPPPKYRGIAAFVRAFPYIHQGVGLLGNALFVAGTVLFLLERQTVALYLFLFGSLGMFVGSLGEIVKTEARKTLKRRDIDPIQPGRRWSERG